MDFEKIQKDLNNKFNTNQRQIIFWYDDKKEFEDEINELSLDNAKVIVLTGSNYFKTKYKLEVEDPSSNYLLYAPFDKPEDSNNPLLDTQLYAMQFYADYYALLTENLGLPLEYRTHLQQFTNFFISKARIDSFKKYNFNFKNELDVDLVILAVLTKSSIVSYIDIFTNIVNKGFEDNVYLKDIDKYGLTEYFWSITSRYFGYDDENPSLFKLMISIYMTNIYSISEVKLPDNLQQYVLNKVSEATVFLNNYKNNTLYSYNFNAMSTAIANQLNIKTSIYNLGFENIKDNDIFKEFDEVYIRYLTDNALNEVNLDKIDQYLSYRFNKHYYVAYKDEYNALKYAYYILKEINKFKNECFTITPSDYTSKYYVIDKYYDLYVYNYDKCNYNGLSRLNELVENKYNNVYLSDLGQYWDKKLREYGDYKNIPGHKQTTFYNKFVKFAEKNEKTCVIISDALRYECGVQLLEYLTDKAKYTCDLNAMISTIPSYTQLGMAALLPNKGIEVNQDYTITIEGYSTQGCEAREKIINKYGTTAKAVQYEVIKNMSRSDMRKAFNNKESHLLYVYHNQIDARGDHALSENEVFKAVQEAIVEIENLMMKLSGDVSYYRFIITADHGFIYRRSKVEEADKIDLETKKDIYSTRRYIYSKNMLDQFGTISYDMKYLNENNNMYALVPNGYNVFKKAGAGQNYVHGGASLQEIVIPVIEAKLAKDAKEITPVNIALLAGNKNITSLLANFKFMQLEVVNDMKCAREFKVYFIDSNNNKISNECKIYANVDVEDMNQRTFTCKFNFIDQRYDSRKDYFMIIEDDKGIEYKREKFIFNISFSNNFGFDI